MTSNNSRRAFVAGMAASPFASIGVLHAPARAAAQFEYRFGNDAPTDSPVNVRAVQMWTAVAKETGGRLVVKTFPNSTLGGDPQMLTQLRSGALQFLTMVGGILASVVPVAAIDGIAFAFATPKDAERAFDGELGAYVRKEILAKGMYAFARIWENGFRQITTASRPVRTAADLVGVKIRTPAGALWIDLFKTLGASPTPINSSELYTALQTHVVDAQENAVVNIEGLRLFEVQKYLNMSNHMWSGYWFLANQDAWNALPPDIRQIVERNVDRYAILQRRDFIALSDALVDKLQRQGMTLERVETSTFRPRLGPFYAKWKGEFGSTAWASLRRYSPAIPA
jgi:tripartite ATP-independent transporter DctP family solute receptor